MTDDNDTLRTRIAEVLNSFPADMRPVAVVNLEKADAIIAELPELQPCPFCGLSHYECDCLRKDATDWKATDD